MIRVGVIGLGEVSQCMHLPILEDLCELYQVTAVSDVSPSLVSYIQKKYHVDGGYLSAEELIAKADTDAVLILSPDQYHCEYAALALRAGTYSSKNRRRSAWRSWKSCLHCKRNTPGRL